MLNGLDTYSYIKFLLTRDYDKDELLKDIETFKKSGDITEEQYAELIGIINNESQDN